MRYGKPIKNKKRVDPRYFLEEQGRSPDELAKDIGARRAEREAGLQQTTAGPDPSDVQRGLDLARDAAASREAGPDPSDVQRGLDLTRDADEERKWVAHYENLGDQSPQMIAVELYNSMKGLGTDETTIWDYIFALSGKHRNKAEAVDDAFKNMILKSGEHDQSTDKALFGRDGSDLAGWLQRDGEINASHAWGLLKRGTWKPGRIYQLYEPVSRALSWG